jgi:DNA ligase (NAD+)
LKNWVKEINVLEWGSTLLEKLVESELVDDIADLYKLSIDQLASLDRMGKKSAQKCYDNLWAASSLPLSVFLGGLSIPLIGQSTIKAIMEAGYTTLEDIQGLSLTQLENINGIGPSRAQSLYQGLQDNKDLIDELLELGVSIKKPTVGTLTGQSFVITGTLSVKRAEVEKMITDNGGEVKSSISTNTTYLIISDPASTSSKAQAARKLGTKLINEAQFMDMIK